MLRPISSEFDPHILSRSILVDVSRSAKAHFPTISQPSTAIGDRDNPFAVHDYTPNRNADGPELFLKGYRSGHLPSDAHAGYDGPHRRDLVEVGCWAHARRKFHEARTSAPERPHAAIARIGRLHGVDREAKDGAWDDARVLTARSDQSRPVLESSWAWLEGEAKKVLPGPPSRPDDRSAICRFPFAGQSRFRERAGVRRPGSCRDPSPRQPRGRSAARPRRPGGQGGYSVVDDSPPPSRLASPGRRPTIAEPPPCPGLFASASRV